MDGTRSRADRASAVRFPLKRDGRDAIWFYVRLLFVAIPILQAAHLFSTKVPSNWDGSDLAAAIGLFVSPMLIGVLMVWERLAGGYELSDRELLIDSGYAGLKLPLDRILEAYRIDIPRAFGAFKPAIRLRLTRAVRGRRTFDLTPCNQSGFVDELAARCPHLVRSEQRLIPRADLVASAR